MATVPILRPYTQGSNLSERYEPVDVPQHEPAQALVDFWNRRPEDGIQVGRDIPSRKIARLLSHVLIWETLAGGEDYRLHLIGETVRLRFDGDARGHRLRELLAPGVVPFFIETGRMMLAKDICRCFDMHVSRQEPIDGQKELHFELVVFPVWSPDRKSRWIFNGLFYF